MRVLLTGASGFLGTHVARELLNRGHRVTALVRSTSRLDLLKKMELDFIEASLPQDQSLGKKLEGFDAVIHAAGVVKALSEAEFYRVNETGTEFLVKEILSLPQVPRLWIHVSTIAVHDASRDGPDFCLHPELCHPVSAYGRSKRAGELALAPLQGRTTTLVLRPPVLYGPGDRELLPLFKACRTGVVPLYRSGKNRLSVCYVEDVARAIADLLEAPLEKDDIFCLDSGESLTWRSMAETLRDSMQRKVRLISVPDFLFASAALVSQGKARMMNRPEVFTLDKMNEIRQSSWVCGHEKLKSRIGWLPKILFPEGSRRTLQAYRESGWIKG